MINAALGLTALGLSALLASRRRREPAPCDFEQEVYFRLYTLSRRTFR